MRPSEGHPAAVAFIRELRGELGGRIRAAWLFGSVARGHAQSGSDVDVLVVLDVHDAPTLRAVYRLAESVSLQRDVDLSVKVMSAAEFERAQGSTFMERVRHEGAALA